MRWYINPIVIGGAILLTLLLFVLVFSIVWLSRPAKTQSGQTTAVLNVIRLPTATQTHTPQPGLVATNTPQPPGDSTIVTGGYIKITGTGGDGLRLRLEPGLKGQIQFVAAENEIFLVENGPQESDGYTWWYLIGVKNETVRGWAVSDFIQAIQYP